MPFNIQGPELIVLLVIALLILGPGKLPEVGAALGRSIREFRKAASDVKEATTIEPKPNAEPAKPDATPAEPPRVAAPVAPSGDGPAATAPTTAEPVAVAPGASDPDSPAS
jgi:TatA/E family protein of Tat protein translocase